MTVKKFSLLATLLSLIFCSCVNRHEGYSFLTLKENPDGLNYTFKIDTLCTYDTFISCKFNAKEVNGTLLKLKVTVTAPQGAAFCDTLSLPLHSQENEVSAVEGIVVYRKGLFTDIQWPYRSGVRSDLIGEWGIAYEILSSSDGINGMGFSYLPTDKR